MGRGGGALPPAEGRGAGGRANMPPPGGAGGIGLAAPKDGFTGADTGSGSFADELTGGG